MRFFFAIHGISIPNLWLALSRLSPGPQGYVIQFRIPDEGTGCTIAVMDQNEWGVCFDVYAIGLLWVVVGCCGLLLLLLLLSVARVCVFLFCVQSCVANLQATQKRSNNYCCDNSNHHHQHLPTMPTT